MENLTSRSRRLTYILLITGSILFVGCKQHAKESKEKEVIVLWQSYNDSAEVAANAEHEKERMRYKFIQSKVLDKNDVFLPLYEEVSAFDFTTYESLKPLILEQNIPSIQQHISEGKFTYEQLVLFYLHRIYKYELDNSTTLNTVIALNPNVLEEARNLDADSKGHHNIYGMPILLKDNIGAQNMKTTAGAIALMENQTDDAFIVKRLKEKGALILGKVNLSEWANFICGVCPNGQSAVGGQTLNPYGRRVFDTGGSSAGSGTSIASNYAVAAVGTETSGSILSPSSQNSVVGMKPTIGFLSRTGIVPISSTLDTPGPMTKNVIDNGILLDAMRGYDDEDSKSVQTDWDKQWYVAENLELKGKRFGAIKNYIETDSIYRITMEKLKAAGATIIEFEPIEVAFDGFLSILNIDMKNDLPVYLKTQVKDKDAVKIENVADAVAFNLQDSLIRIPYGQARFDGILADSTSADGLKEIKDRLKTAGRKYLNDPMDKHQLDAVLSINNYDAGIAAAAEYPALTVPMGYKESGEPISLTFIAKQFQEAKLYELGAAFESLNKVRKIPEGYMD
ncbi:amidase [Flagellimonas sp. HMM57]|uniref:amidase family protein n=1 Tax=unclassified Flagellimonas TaxID=2644544 RepID=UPI0013D5D427|nr:MULTISPECIES: amidase family protein [unclassified Flagellimonas]UII76556.1 amidase [Flagellimonas sp. HMM57]